LNIKLHKGNVILLALTKLLLFALIGTIHSLTYAQNYYSKSFTIADGLNSNNVYDLLEDKYGRIIAATDNGLNIFEGNSIKQIKSNNHLTYLKLSKGEGKTLANTIEGKLVLIHKNNRTNISANQNIIDSVCKGVRPYYIIEDKNRLFFSYASLYEINGTAVKQHIKGGTVLKDWYQVTVFKSSGDFCYFAIDSPILIDNSDYLSFSIPYIEGYYDIRLVKHGDRVFYTYAGNLYEYNKKSTLVTSFQKPNIYAIHANDERLLIGNQKGEIIEYNITTTNKTIIANFTKPITAIITLKSGDIFVSTEGAGIFLINTSFIRKYENIEGNITKSYGINGQLHLILDKDLYNPNLKHLVRKNAQFISNFQGLYIDLYGQNIKTKVQFRKDGLIKFIEPLNDSQFIIPEYKSFSICTKKEKNDYEFNFIESFPFKTSCIKKINDHTLLIGTFNGLVVYDIKNKSYQAIYEEIVEGARINDICKIGPSLFMISVNGIGLFQYNSLIKQLTRLTPFDNIHVYQIIAMDNEQLITYSNTWLYVLDKTHNGGFHISNAYSIEGISDLRIINKSVMICANGLLFELDQNRLSRRNDISIFINQLNYSFAYDSKNKEIPWFTSFIDFPKNDALYHLQIIKKSDTITIETEKNTLDFSGFAFGKYKCLVTLNPSLKISKTIPAIFIEILPPWYFKTSMIVVYFLIILILFFIIIYWIFKRQQQVAYREKEQLVLALNSLKNTFNPHYISNALNGIQHLAFEGNFERLNTYIASFAQWIKMSLAFNERHSVSLNEELLIAQQFLNTEKEKNHFDFKFLILNQSETVFTVPVFLLQPIIENICKYSFKSKFKNKLTISAIVKADILKIYLMDNSDGVVKNNPNSSKLGLKIIKKKLELFDKEMKNKKKSTYQIFYFKGKGTVSVLTVINNIKNAK